MLFRHLMFSVAVLFAVLFGAGNSFAHPQKLHTPPAQSQTHEDGANTHEDGANMPDHAADHDGDDHEAVGEDGGHSHWGLSPDSSPFSRKMAYLGNFHPLLVHFPIALLLVAAFAQLLNLRREDGGYDRAVRLLVWCAAIGAVAAGALGWAHSGPVQHGENGVMSAHRWIGTLLVFGTPVLVWMMQRAGRRDNGLAGARGFTLVLFVFAVTVAVQGFLGGALAHGGMKHLMPSMMNGQMMEQDMMH